MRCVNSAGASSRGCTGVYVGGSGGMHRVIGLGYGDPASRQLLVCELQDAGQVLSEWALDQLERVVLQTGAREWAVCASDLTGYELRQLEALAEALGTVSLTCAPRSVFHSTALEEEVALLARRDQQAPSAAEVSVVEGQRAPFSASAFGMVDPATCGVSRDCLAACIRLLDLTKDPAQWQQFVIGELSLRSFMRLDAAALRALNVFRGDEGGGIGGTSGDGGHDTSLYALLNRCRTRMGAALLRRYLAQPLQDRTRIERRLNAVELLCVDALMRQSLHEDHLKRMPDLGSLCRRLASKRGTLRDVVLLYQTAVRLPSLSCALEEGVRDGCASHAAACEALESDIGRPLQRLSARLESFSATVEKYVDLERIANHEYVVHPGADPELGDIRAEMDTVLARIGDAYEEACSALGLKGAGPQGLDRLKLDRKDGLGYSLRVSRRDEVLIRNQPQYLVLETRKDGVRFTTPALRHLSNRYADAAARYEDKERGIRARALELFGSYLPCFSELAAVVAELDVLVALAVVASTQQWSRPHLLEAADDVVATADPPGLVLRGARHPVVERWLPAGQGFIANDVDLSSPGRLAIITGPNMGGKSVAIRSVGVIVLLAHVGSFVPASHAQIPLVDQILARVGAGDQQTRGVSTFMAEMIDAAAIVRNATRNSLVIIDELGRGTSTQDGYGLAAAICEELARRRSLALVATHFHELTQLATVLPPDTVHNYHVAAEQRPPETGSSRDATGPLVFLYELRPGPSETSFGIHVAEMAGFPEVVLEDARQKAAQLEHCKQVLQLSKDVESPLPEPFSSAST
eukprot:ctg_1327.g437